MYAKINKIENDQLSLSQIMEADMRKPFTIRPRRNFDIAIIVATLIFILYVGQYFVIQQAEDVLPSAEDPSFSPKAKSIFFHEVYRNGLTIRQACAVEAAARAHPNRKIYVLFSVPVADYELKTGCLADLLQFPNVRFLRVHIAEYSKRTIVHSMLLNDVHQSRFRIQHTADILRILTLNKWGGIYLDTDMIVTRSLEDLPSHFVAKETESDVASAILSFAKDEIGTNITNEIIKDISKKYNPSNWKEVGAEAIENVLRRLCPDVFRSEDFKTKPIIKCKEITVFNYELFYPQHWSDVDEIFEYPTSGELDLNRPYTFHMYDYVSHYKPISRGTFYELVAKAFCPTIHSTYSDEFSGKVITS